MPARSRTRGSTFVGPPPATLESLGDKLAARRSVAAAGVPIVPGLLVPLVADGAGSVSHVDLAGVGFPALLKAAAGGGGRGMRQVADRAELEAALPGAGREALAAFGDGTLYLERLISPARHVEVQLLGDRHGNLAVLGERECSVQRRHQKLVEETPSPGASARACARSWPRAPGASPARWRSTARPPSSSWSMPTAATTSWR